jgi:hypothetical protein
MADGTYSQSTGFDVDPVLLFFAPGTQPDLLEARAGTPHPRTDPAHLPHDAQHRPQHPYSTGDSNQLDNVDINVNIDVNAPDGAGPSPEQPTKHSPTHVPPRPDMLARRLHADAAALRSTAARTESLRATVLTSRPAAPSAGPAQPSGQDGEDKSDKKVISPIKRAVQMVRRRPDSTAAPRTALTRAVCLPLQVYNAGGTMSTVRSRQRLRARRRRRR